MAKIKEIKVNNLALFGCGCFIAWLLAGTIAIVALILML